MASWKAQPPLSVSPFPGEMFQSHKYEGDELRRKHRILRCAAAAPIPSRNFRFGEILIIGLGMTSALYSGHGAARGGNPAGERESEAEFQAN